MGKLVYGIELTINEFDFIVDKHDLKDLDEDSLFEQLEDIYPFSFMKHENCMFPYFYGWKSKDIIGSHRITMITEEEKFSLIVTAKRVFPDKVPSFYLKCD